ncbi:MAG: hypothetical protein HWE30_04485 [Methylocystaceae bacterium]|nr:hypothetical protein [Methylocystaceae bacterium]
MIRLLCLLLILSVFLSPKARAIELCDMQTALSSYKAALKRKNLGDEETAFKNFLALAKAGIAPAQRHVAQFYLEESHDDMAIEKGIMWAQLAAWGGDSDAVKIFKSAVQASRYAVVDTAKAWANGWRPTKPACQVAPSEKTAGDDSFKLIGRYPVIRAENLDEDIFVQFGLRLEEALLITEQVNPYFYPLVELIPALEVIAGQNTDRLIQWDEEKGWIQVSAGYRGDETARQLSYSLILATQRYLFDQIEDAEFADPIAGHYGAIKLYGSLYGDAKNARFIGLLQEAIKKARTLPVVMRDKVNLINEVHYMPTSRYHLTRLNDLNRLTYYDWKRSRPDKRMVKLVKKVGFEEPDDVLVELVRMGTQIQQHIQIEGMKGKVDSKKREDAILKALQGDLSAARDAFTNRTAQEKGLVDEWEEKGPDGVRKLNCEAVYWQAKAASLLEMSQIRATRIIKFDGCKKARQVWAEYRNKKAK